MSPGGYALQTMVLGSALRKTHWSVLLEPRFPASLPLSEEVSLAPSMVGDGPKFGVSALFLLKAFTVHTALSVFDQEEKSQGCVTWEFVKMKSKKHAALVTFGGR